MRSTIWSVLKIGMSMVWGICPLFCRLEHVTDSFRPMSCESFNGFGVRMIDIVMLMVQALRIATIMMTTVVLVHFDMMDTDKWNG